MQQHDISVHESCFEVRKRIAKAAKRWIRLKYTVGQGPEFSKYVVQMLTWKNVDGCLEPATSDDAPYTVTVNDQFGRSHDIKRVEPDEPLEGLGFLRTALGSQTHQFRKDISDAGSLAERLRRGSAMKTR